MNIKTVVIVIALCIIHSSLLAQGNFRSGSIIKANGDTVAGFISYNGFAISPDKIQFKKSLSISPGEVFFAKDINGVIISGIAGYASYNGFVSTNRTADDDIPNVQDTSTKSVSVFLTVLINGANVKLLEYTDEFKTVYFISEENGTPVELKYYRYRDDNVVQVSAPYKTLLIRLLEKYRGEDNKWFGEVGNSAYKLSALRKIVNEINGSKAKDFSLAGHRMFAGASVAYSHFNVDGPKSIPFQNAEEITPVIKWGYDFYANKVLQKLIFRLEASGNYMSPVFKNEYALYSYKALLLTLKPQLLLKVIGGEQSGLYIGGGLRVNVPLQFSNKITATESGVILSNGLSSQPKGNSYLSLQAGQSVNNPYGSLVLFVTPEANASIFINNKWDINLSASFKGTNMFKTTYLSSMVVYSAGVNYHFHGKNN